jgi:predicted enzyme related to lactoylglutathione lyase
VLNRVKDAGGKVVMEKTLINSDLGYIAGFEDTEGNQLLVHSLN